MLFACMHVKGVLPARFQLLEDLHTPYCSAHSAGRVHPGTAEDESSAPRPEVLQGCGGAIAVLNYVSSASMSCQNDLRLP